MIAIKVTDEVSAKLGVKTVEELQGLLDTIGTSGGLAFVTKAGEIFKVTGDLSPAAVAEAIAASKVPHPEVDPQALTKITGLETALTKLQGEFTKFVTENPKVDIKSIATSAAAEAVATAVANAGGQPLKVALPDQPGNAEAPKTKAEAIKKLNELNASNPRAASEYAETHKKLLNS